MSREYETVCGITQDELEKYFERPIREFTDYRTYRLDIPNNEVKDGFVTMVAACYLGNRSDCYDTGISA